MKGVWFPSSLKRAVSADFMITLMYSPVILTQGEEYKVIVSRVCSTGFKIVIEGSPAVTPSQFCER